MNGRYVNNVQRRAGPLSKKVRDADFKSGKNKSKNHVVGTICKSLCNVHREMSQVVPQTYYTIDGLYLCYAAARRQREREVVRAVKLLKQNQSMEL
jgi:hypothetical protein